MCDDYIFTVPRQVEDFRGTETGIGDNLMKPKRTSSSRGLPASLGMTAYANASGEGQD